MSSGRTLGRGRVLGNARTLGPPPTTASPSPRPQHKRNVSLLAPSESSLSISSQISTSPSPGLEDITSRVSIGQSNNAAAAAAGSRLVCPICGEEMVTLLQLNRHLDDLHQNLEEVEQDEVKTWFKAQMSKAKKFQPLVALNQKFKGLDVFEANDAAQTSARPAAPSSGHSTPEVRVVDPDEVVTRTHWQKPGYQDACLDPMCGKRLGGANGQVNCRKCGKLFCEEHTMYQMKLSRSAQHEPIRGTWCRVCETCYKSREGYNDHTSLERNHTSDFTSMRRKMVDKNYLDVSRLEKRLSKLTSLLANPPPQIEPDPSATSWWGLGSGKSQQRALEQSVVDWEDDASVLKCPFCQQEFSTYTFRRHHCRTCGRVVCGDVRTDCSAEVPLNVATDSNPVTEKTQNIVSLDVRICKDCRHTLFSKADFARELAHKPPDQRSYENLAQFERGIRLLLPKFQRLLVALQDPNNPPTSAEIAEASKVRKRLTDSFLKYEAAARRIRDMPTTSPTQERLQKAVYTQASSFLHLHMLPLKSLPKVLKHASPHGQGSHASKSASSGLQSKSNGALASIRFNDLAETGSQVSSATSAIESLEAEEKELKERLIVLEEQRFIVQEMVNDARKHRRFDELQSLSSNVDDLTREIDGVQGLLDGLDFKGAYAEAGLAAGEVGRASPLPTVLR